MSLDYVKLKKQSSTDPFFFLIFPYEDTGYLFPPEHRKKTPYQMWNECWHFDLAPLILQKVLGI